MGTTSPHPRARHPGPSVDVVLVHGLMGTPLTTWRVGDAPSTRASEVIESPKAGASSAAASTSVHLWPVEWLVRDLGQRGASVRLLSVEYNGNMTSGWHSHPPRDLEELARVLRHQLHAANVGLERPVVFLAHSLGGLLVKQVLVDSAQDSSDTLAAATAAVVFFGVPHFGSALAMKGSSNPLVNFIAGPLVKDLGQGNPRLITLDQRFTDLPHTFTVNNLAESKSTVVNLGVSVSIPIVSQASARSKRGDFKLFDSDHIAVCKPYSDADPIYSTVLKILQQNPRLGLRVPEH